LGLQQSPAATRHATACRLIAAVAKLIADAHDRGFVHRDLHPGNILIREEPGHEVEALLVDLLGARAGRAPALVSDRAINLAQLNQFFQRAASPRERLRFVVAYTKALRLAHGKGLPPTRLRQKVRELLPKITAATRKHGEALVRQRDARIHQNGKYFGRIPVAPGCTATVVLTLARRLTLPGPVVPDRTHEQWRELLRPAIDPCGDAALLTAHGLRIEWTHVNSLAARLRWRMVGSPARERFVRSHRLRHRDRPGELVLGYLEVDQPGRRSCGVILPLQSVVPLPLQFL
jgi:hypothetical protein